eukprot:gene5744-4105_t
MSNLRNTDTSKTPPPTTFKCPSLLDMKSTCFLDLFSLMLCLGLELYSSALSKAV